jgi:toxin-antitoxin system PIN domain toxin
LDKYLIDVNLLVALTDREHIHYERAMGWLDRQGHRDWGVCAFTEAGFLRVVTNPKAGSYSMAEAIELLRRLKGRPGYRYWPVGVEWISLAAPFLERVFGHQQITDACLLGLAIRGGGVLVTMDKGIQFLAGATYKDHVLVLE